MEAGRTIWGFPKIMAEFTVREGDRIGFSVSENGQLIAKMEFSRALPIPSFRSAAGAEDLHVRRRHPT